MLQEFVAEIRLKLNQQSRKFEYANPYSHLLFELLHPSGNPIAEPRTAESGSLGGAFELVEMDRLQQLREKFEAVIFTPIMTDEVEIDNYMSSMFPEEGEEAIYGLQDLRKAIKSFSKEFSGRKTPFDLSVPRWCIGSLLKSDLLSEEQKSTLEEFLANDVVPAKIDVLRIRFADL